MDERCNKQEECYKIEHPVAEALEDMWKIHKPIKLVGSSDPLSKSVIAGHLLAKVMVDIDKFEHDAIWFSPGRMQIPL